MPPPQWLLAIVAVVVAVALLAVTVALRMVYWLAVGASSGRGRRRISTVFHHRKTLSLRPRFSIESEVGALTWRIKAANRPPNRQQLEQEQVLFPP